MKLIASWVVFSLFCEMVLGRICKRNGSSTCCSGYRWNKTTNLCDECPPGYRGIECIYKCEYSTYGSKCEKACACPQDQCDFVFGCKQNNSVTVDFSKEHEVTLAKGTPRTTMNKRNSIIEGHTFNGTTLRDPASIISSSIVFYTVVALIAVFVIFALFYGVSYLPKSKFCKKDGEVQESDLKVDEACNSHYQDLPFP